MARLDPKKQMAKPVVAKTVASKPAAKSKAVAEAPAEAPSNYLPPYTTTAQKAAATTKIAALQRKVDAKYGAFVPGGQSFGANIRENLPNEVSEVHRSLAQNGKLIEAMADIHNSQFGLSDDTHSEITKHLATAQSLAFDAQQRASGGDRVGASTMFSNANREHQLAAKKIVRNTSNNKAVMPAIFDIADGDTANSLNEAHIKALG
jgi:hypothetical protein